jgi:hypothetical protein
MLEIQRKYIHINNNFDVYFIAFDSQQLEDIILMDDIIYVKGEESLINILNKTIQGLNYLINILGYKYDYVVRTNISTLINLNNLYKFLDSSPRNLFYSGGHLETIGWPLAINEICESKQNLRYQFYNTKFIQGTSIILSIDIVNHLLSNQHLIEYDIVDDVKLGLLIKDLFPDVYNNLNQVQLAYMTYNYIESNSIFIRNKTNDRLLDINVMILFVDILLN